MPYFRPPREVERGEGGDREKEREEKRKRERGEREREGRHSLLTYALNDKMKTN